MYVEETSLTLKIRVVVEPDEGRFHAYCPAFKGLHVDGDTPQEALNNAGAAAAVYITSLAQNQEAIPIGPFCQNVEQERIMKAIPAGAMQQDVELSWPSRKMCGTR